MHWGRAGLVLGLVVLGMGVVALAAGTPAGTQIKNQAMATYTDQNGVSRTAASNEVITVVSQVAGLTITPNGTETIPGQSQEAAPGNTVYFSYTLVNTGNGPDTYALKLVNSTSDDFDPTSGLVYVDTNGNGLVDPGEPLLTSGFGAYGTVTPSVPADSQIKLIVAYTIPTIATSGQVTKVNLIGQSQTDPTATDGDAGAPYDIYDNWNQTTVTTDANVTATKAASPATVAPGDTVTYVVSGSNTGNKAALSQDLGTSIDSTQHEGILVSDAIPSHTTLVSSSWSGAPTNGFAVFSTDGGTTWTSTAPTLTTVTDIGWFMPDTNDGDGNQESVLDPGQGYRFTFEVTVNSDAPAGIIPNTATVEWADSTGAPKGTLTNEADVLVSGSYTVFIGPQGTPEATGPTDTNDDTTDAGTQAAGTWVSFTNTVENAGNSADTLDITVPSAPSSWQVQLYKSDGITPLPDTNGDGTPDVGSLAAGATADIVVKVFIPYGTAADADGATTVHDMVVQATSSANPDQWNRTIDRVTDIIAAGVDLSNAPYNESAVTKTTNPGVCVDFPLVVINTAGAPDTYDLTVSSTLPANWAVTFLPDVNLDETADSSSPITAIGPLGGAVLTAAVTSSATLPVSNTSYLVVGDHVRIAGTDYTVQSVDASAGTITIDSAISADQGTVVGEEQGVIAEVCVPSTQAPGDTDITFQATSNNDPTKNDAITDTVTVNSVAGVSLSPDRSGTGSPGGTVVYEHTLCNTGNVDDVFDLSYVSDWGWSYTFTDPTTGDPIQTVSVAAGSCVPVDVTAFIPSDAAIDQLDVVTITATGETHGATASAQDTTRVVQGLLRLQKSVSPTGDQAPGTVLTYTTDYTNLGNSSITDVFIYDAVPSYTAFVVGSATGGSAVVYSDDGGATWTYTPTADTNGTDSNVTNIRWQIGTLAAGGSGTVTFQVRIND